MSRINSQQRGTKTITLKMRDLLRNGSMIGWGGDDEDDMNFRLSSDEMLPSLASSWPFQRPTMKWDEVDGLETTFDMCYY
jgi:hypothetical protein